MWSTPACRNVRGTAAVTFTLDDGNTLAPVEGVMERVAYTYGLAALDTPNVLLAQHQGRLLRSVDAGCTWHIFGTGVEWLVLSAAPGGYAYGWSDNDDKLFKIDAENIVRLPLPLENLVGLGVHPDIGSHLRICGSNGELWASWNGGQHWGHLSTLPLAGASCYCSAFDPHDPDHVVCGLHTEGAYVTTDGGRSWSFARGLEGGGRGTNVFKLAISPADPRVVWAMAVDLREVLAGDPSEGRHIYLSQDGGHSFRPVLGATEQVRIPNAPLLAPHPREPDILYFVFGSAFKGHGTDLYRLEGRTGSVTCSHNAYDSISSIAFSPADPTVIYLGLSSEKSED